jgi:hypothetical protein
MIRLQQVRHDLKKLKDFLHSIAEGAAAGIGEELERGGREEVESRRRQTKLTERLTPLLNLIEADRIEEYFGSRSHKEIWQEMVTNEDHRARVIEWLEATLPTQVSGKIEEMKKQAQAQKVQEAYQTSKRIAMRRSIEK